MAMSADARTNRRANSQSADPAPRSRIAATARARRHATYSAAAASSPSMTAHGVRLLAAVITRWMYGYIPREYAYSMNQPGHGASSMAPTTNGAIHQPRTRTRLMRRLWPRR